LECLNYDIIFILAMSKKSDATKSVFGTTSVVVYPNPVYAEENQYISIPKQICFKLAATVI